MLRHFLFYYLFVTLLNQPLAVSADSFLVDGRQRKVNISKRPERIASGSLASDEIILELLRRSSDVKRLVAVSPLAANFRYSNIVDSIQNINYRFGNELEGLIALKPDLVILASFNQPAFVSLLEKQTNTFVLSTFNQITDIIANIDTIGKLIHAEQAARQLITDFADQLKTYSNRIPKQIIANPDLAPTVLNYSDDDHVYGSETMFDSIVRTAGAVNLPSRMAIKGWQKLNNETIATLNPALIIAPGELLDRRGIVKRIQSRPGWKNLAAVKQEHILIIPERELLALSPHAAKAVKRVNRTLYLNKK